MIRNLNLLLVLLVGWLPANLRQPEQPAKRQAFEQVFGDAVRLDPAMIKQLLQDNPGKRHYVDHDKDGIPEEVWFVDTDRRHSDNRRPVLVRVIDEDGDLRMGGLPDRDTDLWVADWHADGLVDAVIDYEDDDGDGDLDQMSMFFYDQRQGLRVWWSHDDGDDNLLWYDQDYVYEQAECQYKSHFGGDESFSGFYYDPGQHRWIPFSENPFLFFDPDHDGVTEEVVRMAGHDDQIRSVRWSFDADNDGSLKQPRNFDAGITVLAPGWTPANQNSSLTLPSALCDTLLIRNIPAGPLLRRGDALRYLSEITWGRALLSWDENDWNKAWNNPRDTIHRWEGIIAAASTDSVYYMPRVGGPDCGPFNKRYELLLQPEGPLQFYYHPSDHRIHLKHSDRSWLVVDYDGDGKADMRYLWQDRDGDGLVDYLELDLDADGQVDDGWPLDSSKTKPLDWSFEALQNVYQPVAVYETGRKYRLARLLQTILAGEGEEDDPLWPYVENSHSDESLLYHLGLCNDRQIVRLRRMHSGKKSFWEDFYAARSKNDVEAMQQLLQQEFRPETDFPDFDNWLSDIRREPPRQRVAWNDKWFPPNWCWESEQVGFRTYDGHIDLFGKRSDRLIVPDFVKITRQNYHKDLNPWGMDILEAGESGGCGAIILYVDGKAYPVYRKTEEKTPVFAGRLVEETAYRVVIEQLASEVVPGREFTVRIRPSAHAGRSESHVEVLVEGGRRGERLELGIGLTRFPQEDFLFDRQQGIMGLWGQQNPEIGPVGMGILFPADAYVRLDQQPYEHRVVLRCEAGKPLEYRIRYCWQKGMRFSTQPSADDWLRHLQQAVF